MLESIIFDMDGTLYQTNKILELSLEDTFNYLTSLGKWEGQTPIEKYREIMGVPLPQAWETLLPNHSKNLIEETRQKKPFLNENKGFY
ncbi:HAD hydrolase-like protein [Neobacillus sp. NPDC093182]|uniref:HAD hydrolase-like protein n=1 Tax=Neobacillus sp. NPDC093182 TaxID=3364297 RepID=UPI003827C409